MIRIELTELGVTQHRLSTEQGQRLARSGVVTAAPSALVPGEWSIAARGKIGVARVGDLEVWIDPKVDIARLLFLVGYATHPSAWRDESVRIGTGNNLVPAVAAALWRQVERALQQGLIQGYREHEDTSYVLRGRLREADQLRKQHGRVIPMELRYDEFTVDIPENQILLAAITRMLTVPGVDVESRRRLAALRVRLADVTTLVRGTRLPAWQPSRLNTRYHNALRLAEIVCRATSPEFAPGTAVTNGFLFDLQKIFEDFVTVAVKEALHADFGGAAYQQFQWHLDEASIVSMKPDLVWKLHGKPVAVADAKYKQETPDGHPNADLYQMLAYCTALGLPRGHLIYAKGNAEPARHVVRQAGVEIVCHALDLAQQQAELLGQISAITAQLAAA
jgi:5-methylcytosine-specific restriction enzyme subunit McrC